MGEEFLQFFFVLTHAKPLLQSTIPIPISLTLLPTILIACPCAQWVALLQMRYFNPKYSSHVYKVTVAVDNLGNIVWVCDCMLETTADVMVWDARGPSCTRGQFLEFEIGAHDGAHKGRRPIAVPYIGHKT